MNTATKNPSGDLPIEGAAWTGSRLRVVQFAVLVVFAWMFRPIVTGQIYVTDDLLNYHYPIRQFYQNCLVSGDAFDWMPSLFSGFYLTGSGQAGTYHPLHWGLYRFLPLETAFNLEVLSSYVVMFPGMLLFLRRHLATAEAAWLGAIAFTFSGFCTLHFLHPNSIAVVSHLPWLLICIDRILRPSPGRSVIAAEIGLALLTGSQILLGYPQYVWYSVLTEIVYCLMIAPWNALWSRRSACIAFLKLVGLMLGAVQLLPSMEALNESERKAMSAEYFGLFPLSPADLLQWFSPYLTKSRVFGLNTHDLGAYFGAVPLLLLTFCCLRLRLFWKPQPLFRVMIILLVVSLWLSFGRNGGLYILQTKLPLIGKFRWPSRIVVLVHLAAATLSAITLEYLLRSRGANSSASQTVSKLWAIPIISILASAGVYMFLTTIPRAPLSLLIIGPILFALAVLMLKDVVNGKAATGLLLFVLGDLVSYGFTYEALSSVQSPGQVINELKRPPGAPDSGKVLAETHGPKAIEGFGGNQLTLAGYQQADGYEGLIPQIYLPDENMSLATLRIMGVRWVVNAPVHREIEGLVPTTDHHWLECPDPLPRFRLSNRVTVVPDSLEAARKIGSNAGDILALSTPVDSSELQAEEKIQVLADRPGYIELAAKATKPRVILVSERYSSGWKCHINGQLSKIVRANSDYFAVPVGAGESTIILRFEPAGLQRGRLISLVTITLLGAFAIGRFLFTTRRLKKETACKEAAASRQAV